MKEQFGGAFNDSNDRLIDELLDQACRVINVSDTPSEGFDQVIETARNVESLAADVGEGVLVAAVMSHCPEYIDAMNTYASSD